MTHDGLGKYLSEIITKADGPTADIATILKESKADVLVSYLPVGSEEATKWYVEQALAAGVAYVNCVPVFIAREKYWSDRFEKAGLPIVGDDIKSQVGATIVHRQLARLFRQRGVLLERTHQLNVGGNTDFLNMLERERLESKKISKTNAVTSTLDYEMDPDDVHIGPSDHVAWLKDRKWAYIRLEGRAFGDVPLNVELKLEVWDSPNSAGIVIDAVRFAKLALDNGLAGALEFPSAYLMKSPPVQHPDEFAREQVEDFIRVNARPGAPVPAAPESTVVLPRTAELFMNAAAGAAGRPAHAQRALVGLHDARRRAARRGARGRPRRARRDRPQHHRGRRRGARASRSSAGCRCTSSSDRRSRQRPTASSSGCSCTKRSRAG